MGLRSGFDHGAQERGTCRRGDPADWWPSLWVAGRRQVGRSHRAADPSGGWDVACTRVW